MIEYLKKQGEAIPLDVYRLAQDIIGWSELHMVSISTKIHQREKEHSCRLVKSADQTIPTEWSLHPWVFNDICREFDRPHVSLFATRANTKFFCSFHSRTYDMKQDVFQHLWDELSMYAFPSFTLLWWVLSRILRSSNLSMILVAPFWTRKERYPDPLDLMVEESFELFMLWNLLVQPHVRKFHRDP